VVIKSSFQKFLIVFSCSLLIISKNSLAFAGKNSDLVKIAKAIRPTTDFIKPEPFERRPGGAATVFKFLNQNSFSHNSANMSFERELDFKIGNAFFRRIWVSSPASTISADGLGPLFNARSCQNCHIKDGRGHTPSANWPKDDAVSMILRLSIPPQNKEQKKLILENRLKNIPDPTYGFQLQDLAIQGHNAEGKIRIEYKEIEKKFADGTIVSLRKPNYSIISWKYGSPNKELQISPRIAPPMIGLGLLEAISEKDILINEDPGDKNNDGISGKANKVWDIKAKKVKLGRFGWKAGEPNISQQSSKAFNGDIGISAPLAQEPWGDCSQKQNKCRNAPNGNTPSQNNLEISLESMKKIIFYAKNLGVPARRDIEKPNVLAGKKLFYKTGCISCHRPKFVTRRLPNNLEQSFQLIWPYSDMLLHDMGEELADERPEGLANGKEWRTPPLWGIGLTKIVNGHTQFLHDGRARNLLEAILWHGGESKHIIKNFLKFNSKERIELLAFLNSL